MFARSLASDGDAGVGQREDGHDEKGRPGLQDVFHAEHRSLSLLGGLLELPECRVVLLGAGVLAIDRAPLEVVHEGARPCHEGVRVEARSCRDGEGEQYACDRGMDARLEDRHPEGDTQQRVHEGRRTPRTLAPMSDPEDDDGRRQRRQ